MTERLYSLYHIGYIIFEKPGFILINFIKHVKGRLTYFLAVHSEHYPFHQTRADFQTLKCIVSRPWSRPCSSP